MIVYGKQVVLYLLNRHKDRINEIILTKKVEKPIYNLIKKYHIKLSYIDEKKAIALSKSNNHQGIFAKIDEIEINNFSLKDLKKIVVLVGVTDMGNVGAIIRTAYALGMEAVFVTNIKNINLEGVVKSSSGAVFDIKLGHKENIYDFFNELKTNNFFTIGATLNGQDKINIKSDKIALLLGSEAEGLPNRLVKKLDLQTTIKMKNGFNSLNVSSAGAILIDRITNERT